MDLGQPRKRIAMFRSRRQSQSSYEIRVPVDMILTPHEESISHAQLSH
jgi:hypothetical protein